MSSLRELQHAFAAALRGDATPLTPRLSARSGIEPLARLAVYRNNGEAIFEATLARTYPVLRRRVGEDYFRTLTRDYRLAHPSPSGDLHWVGRDFAAFLERTLAESPYVWLADLARLEWACEEALVAADANAVGAEVLAGFTADALADARFALHPSTRCVSSAYPVFTIWRLNQDTVAAPVDLAAGGEHVVLRAGARGAELYSRTRTEVQLVERLAGGLSLGDALEELPLAAEELREVLGWLFASGFVTRVDVSRPDAG